MTGNTPGGPLRAAGTFVIPWKDVCVEGSSNLPLRDLAVGQELTLDQWPSQLDSPDSRLVLSGATGLARLHARAARVARVLARTEGIAPPALPDPEDALMQNGMIVTDGHTAYTCVVVDAAETLLVFHGRSPAPGDKLWIVRIDGALTAATSGDDANPHTHPAVVCFAAGTPIATPYGPCPVENLRPGELVLTRDGGAMPVRWRGQQTLSAARLMAMPHLRPVRIRAGALGIERPEGDILLSPDHRVMVSGPAATALFGMSEVLVRAGDLRDAPGVSRDMSSRDVTYVHIALNGHHVLEASGLPVESFDPGSADLRALNSADRSRLFDTFPELRTDQAAFGPPARRVLKMSEAAILGHRMH